MSTKGRKPIPTAIKKLKGTARKSRQKNEPKTKALISLPMPPQEWDKPEQDRWHRVCAMLQTNRLLDAINIEIIQLYVLEMKKYFDAVDQVEKLGPMVTSPSTGELKMNPWIRYQDMAFKNILAISREFGFTPSAKSRIHVPSGKDEENNNDEFGDV